MELTPMQYKSYVWPHNPRTYTIQYVRKVAVHKVPFGRYAMQDLGLGRRVMKGEGEFYGAGAYEEFKKLASVFYHSGPGTLIHPVWQSAKAYFDRLHPQTGELSDSELDNVSGGCGGGYDAGRPQPRFAVGETVLYIHSWLGATRITATGKVVKRSYENDGWYYTLKIHDGSEIKMSESHVIKC